MNFRLDVEKNMPVVFYSIKQKSFKFCITNLALILHHNIWFLGLNVFDVAAKANYAQLVNYTLHER